MTTLDICSYRADVKFKAKQIKTNNKIMNKFFLSTYFPPLLRQQSIKRLVVCDDSRGDSLSAAVTAADTIIHGLPRLKSLNGKRKTRRS